MRRGELASGNGLAAPILQAGSGRPYALLDGRTAALLTVWHGTELPRTEMEREMTAIAGFLGRLRRLFERSGAEASPGPKRPWVESWRERLRRLETFASLAARRLHPTEFDRVFLARFETLREEAERSLLGLEAAAHCITSGVGLDRVERSLFYQRGDGGMGLKSPIGLAAAEPMRDLHRLFARYLPRTGFHPRAAASALAAYAAEHLPAREELALLAAALRFPEDYYRLACRYFLNGESWPLRTFLRRERRIWAAEAARRALVEEIPFLLS